MTDALLVHDRLTNRFSGLRDRAGKKLFGPRVALFSRSCVEQKLGVVLRDQSDDVLLLGVVGRPFDDRVVDEDGRAGRLRLLKIVRILEET